MRFRVAEPPRPKQPSDSSAASTAPPPAAPPPRARDDVAACAASNSPSSCSPTYAEPERAIAPSSNRPPLLASASKSAELELAQAEPQPKTESATPREPDRESDSGSSLATEAYNSEDEHGARAAEVAAAAAAAAAGGTASAPLLTTEEREAMFRADLSRRAWRVAEVRADGNCLFRAIAYAAWGDEELHGMLRARVMDYEEEERDYFSQFVAEDFPRYVRRKRRDGTHGNHVELQAAADMLSTRIEVYAYSLVPVAVVAPAVGGTGHTLRLSFHRGSHYNAIVGSTPPAKLCPKKLAAAATRRSGTAAADEARIAALADTLATEEELEQVALELSIAESHRARLRSRSGSGSGSASAAAGSSSRRAWAAEHEVRGALRALAIGGKAGPSSAGGPSHAYAESSDDEL